MDLAAIVTFGLCSSVVVVLVNLEFAVLLLVNGYARHRRFGVCHAPARRWSSCSGESALVSSR
ncbi:hypothetical protein Dimus_024588 [Dionaea muscipula]